jgi:hypothetical protein
MHLNERDDEGDKKKKLWKEMNFRERCGHIKKNVTIEPMLAFYIMPSVLAGLATQNLNLEKACRVNLAYGDTICDALSARETANYTEEEKNVQQLVATMQGWKTILQSAMPCLLILFWYERHTHTLTFMTAMNKLSHLVSAHV